MTPHIPDWSRLVAIDFETYYDQDYTLKKLSTSEYVRDPRFKAQMLGIRIGNGKTRTIPHAKIAQELGKINWATHSVLAHNCVPGDTEVLTREGWKPIRYVAAETEIMQWDSATGELTWCLPLGKTITTAKELIQWDTEFHRAAYTPGHRMYYQTPDRSDWRVATAEVIAEASQNNTYIPISGVYAGSTIELTADEARFMEAIRADGSWCIQDGACYGVQFNLRKPRKIARLQNLCEALNIAVLGPSASGRFRINTCDVVRRIFVLLTATKQYDLWVLELSEPARSAILEELQFWDGHDTGSLKGFAWATADHATARAVELMAHTTGKSISGRWGNNARGFNAHNPNAALFTATIRDRARVKLVSKPIRKKHNGKVYCFTVPTGAFMIRAGGRICITGNCAFDGFILSHHYGVIPAYYYDTLSMARGLHSNEIGAGLDEVSVFYGGHGKMEGLENTCGVLNWSKELFAATAIYCSNDADEMIRIFKLMLPQMPSDEMDLINLTCRMFCDPVLRVDIPRVEAELKRELDRREELLTSIVDLDEYDPKELLKGKERNLEPKERDMLMVKRIIGSAERFAELLRAEGIEPPVKISPAWMKLPKEERESEEGLKRKYTYAFAKDDHKFTDLSNRTEDWGFDLNNPEHVEAMIEKQERIQALVDSRIITKSTTNVTRAERFLKAGADGLPLPVGYSYFRASTGRFGGTNKMNFQNLPRGGELRLSILAPKGHMLATVDSGQIEARVNAWLWGQEDVLDAFRAADNGTGRDAYCNFADHIYGRTITKADALERQVGKLCIAEDELVLTDRGLVPIHLISNEDRLWDGLEWVIHDGVLDQGIREVITYDGLTATPDHEVFTEDGRIVPLGQAASEMARLQNTGVEGQAVRFCDDHVIADTPRKWLSVRVGTMQPKRCEETDIPEQSEKRENNIVPEERATPSRTRRGAGETVRRHPSQVQQPEPQGLDELRWTGDQVSVQEQDGIYPVGGGEPTSQGLQRGGDRSGEQRRELRAGEPTAGYSPGEHAEPAQYRTRSVARGDNPAGRFPKSIQLPGDISVREIGTDGRTDHSSSTPERSREAEKLARNTRQARCYDIANAGPRKRYTVSGKLVLNCVLGLGYQMGAAKFQTTLAKNKIYYELDRCREIVDTYRKVNHRIVAGWRFCDRIINDMFAGRAGHHGPIAWEKETIFLPNGMRLKYPDLKKTMGDEYPEWTYQSKDSRKKIYSGLGCENLVQSLARIIVMWQMLQVDKKYRVVLTCHDEFSCVVKKSQAEKCLEFMTQWMKTPPDWCPDLPLNSEGKVDVNYSK